MTRPADVSQYRGQTQLIEQAARDAWAWTDDKDHDRLPQLAAYPLTGLLSALAWALVAGVPALVWWAFR